MSLHRPDDFTRPSGQASTTTRSEAPGPIPLHRAEALTRGGSLANIELSGKVYALRITRAGKLILTK